MSGARLVAFLLAGVVAPVLVGTGCDGDGDVGPASAPTAAVCPLLTRLGESAVTVERVDVADPDAFAAALDDAVAQYVATVSKLRPMVPDELHDDVDRLEAAVLRHDFDAAVTARASLDDYEALECRTPTSTDAVAER